MKVQGKVALVTGAGRRLGRVIALALAKDGARVSVHYHSSEAAARTVVEEIRAMGREACLVRADQRHLEEIEAAIGETVAALGEIDILVNSAAIFERAPTAEVELEVWDRHMNVNLRGPYLFARAVAPAMRRKGAGKIVNLVDVAADRPWPGYLAYSVSKAGLVALTRGLARALAPEIQVNGVAPGIILAPEHWTEEELATALKRVPMKRAGEAGDIAQTVQFLIEGPDYVTGAIIPVDGGQTTR
jgi:pteridine reductase